MSLVASSSLGGRLDVDHLESCIWLILISILYFKFVLMQTCIYQSFDKLPLYLFILFDSFIMSICISGVNVQTGEEVGVKLVSFEF